MCIWRSDDYNLSYKSLRRVCSCFGRNFRVACRNEMHTRHGTMSGAVTRQSEVEDLGRLPRLAYPHFGHYDVYFSNAVVS